MLICKQILSSPLFFDLLFLICCVFFVSLFPFNGPCAITETPTCWISCRPRVSAHHRPSPRSFSYFLFNAVTYGPVLYSVQCSYDNTTLLMTLFSPVSPLSLFLFVLYRTKMCKISEENVSFLIL